MNTMKWAALSLVRLALVSPLATVVACVADGDPDASGNEVTQESNQAWWGDQQFGLRSFLEDYHYAMDIPGGSHTPGERVTLYPVHGRSNQQWRLDGAMFKNVESGLCLNLAGNYVNPGTAIQQWYCDRNDTANWWSYTELGELQKTNTNMCVDVPGGNVFPGQVLELYPCHGGYNQRWSNYPIP